MRDNYLPFYTAAMTDSMMDPQGSGMAPGKTTQVQQADETITPQDNAGEVSFANGQENGEPADQHTTGTNNEAADNLDNGSIRRHLGEITKAVHLALNSDNPKEELKKVLADPKIRAAYEKKYGALDDEGIGAQSEDPLAMLMLEDEEEGEAATANEEEPETTKEPEPEFSAELTQATAIMARSYNLGLEDAQKIRAYAKNLQALDADLSVENALENARYRYHGAAPKPGKPLPKAGKTMPAAVEDDDKLTAEQYAQKHNLIGEVT